MLIQDVFLSAEEDVWGRMGWPYLGGGSGPNALRATGDGLGVDLNSKYGDGFGDGRGYGYDTQGDGESRSWSELH